MDVNTLSNAANSDG